MASNGSLSWRGRFIFISEALAEHLGLEEVDDLLPDYVLLIEHRSCT